MDKKSDKIEKIGFDLNSDSTALVVTVLVVVSVVVGIVVAIQS